MQVPGNFAKVINKAPIEIDKAQEFLDSLLVGGNHPVDDYSDLGWVHLDLPIPHNDAQVVDTGPFEDALLLLETQTVLL